MLSHKCMQNAGQLCNCRNHEQEWRAPAILAGCFIRPAESTVCRPNRGVSCLITVKRLPYCASSRSSEGSHVWQCRFLAWHLWHSSRDPDAAAVRSVLKVLTDVADQAFLSTQLELRLLHATDLKMPAEAWTLPQMTAGWCGTLPLAATWTQTSWARSDRCFQYSHTHAKLWATLSHSPTLVSLTWSLPLHPLNHCHGSPNHQP